MQNITPMALAKQFANEVEKHKWGSAPSEYGDHLFPKDPFVVHVKDKKETEVHGYLSGAVASVVYEGGVDLISILGQQEWFTTYKGVMYYIDAYSSYPVGVFPF